MPKNRSSSWISIKKSIKLDSLLFHWEILTRICKTVVLNSGLLSDNNMCTCKTAALENSFQIFFLNFKKKRETGIKICFWILHFTAGLKISRFQNLYPDFSVECTLNSYLNWK